LTPPSGPRVHQVDPGSKFHDPDLMVVCDKIRQIDVGLEARSLTQKFKKDINLSIKRRGIGEIRTE